MISPTDRELVQENILLQCHIASRKGVPFHVVVTRVQSYGYAVTDKEVDEMIRYLEGKNFILEVTRNLAPENRRYLASSEGTDYLRKEGLV